MNTNAPAYFNIDWNRLLCFHYQHWVMCWPDFVPVFFFICRTMRVEATVCCPLRHAVLTYSYDRVMYICWRMHCAHIAYRHAIVGHKTEDHFRNSNIGTAKNELSIDETFVWQCKMHLSNTNSIRKKYDTKIYDPVRVCVIIHFETREIPETLWQWALWGGCLLPHIMGYACLLSEEGGQRFQLGRYKQNESMHKLILFVCWCFFLL